MNNSDISYEAIKLAAKNFKVSEEVVEMLFSNKPAIEKLKSFQKEEYRFYFPLFDDNGINQSASMVIFAWLIQSAIFNGNTFYELGSDEFNEIAKILYKCPGPGSNILLTVYYIYKIQHSINIEEAKFYYDKSLSGSTDYIYLHHFIKIIYYRKTHSKHLEQINETNDPVELSKEFFNTSPRLEVREIFLDISNSIVALEKWQGISLQQLDEAKNIKEAELALDQAPRVDINYTIDFFKKYIEKIDKILINNR